MKLLPEEIVTQADAARIQQDGFNLLAQIHSEERARLELSERQDNILDAATKLV